MWAVRWGHEPLVAFVRPRSLATKEPSSGFQMLLAPFAPRAAEGPAPRGAFHVHSPFVLVFTTHGR